MSQTSPTFHVPSNLPGFSEKTLLICSSTREAQVYLCEQTTMTELPESPVHTQKTEYSYTDKEGDSRIRGTVERTIPGEKETIEQHYNKIYIKYLSEQIEALAKKHSIKAIVIFVPDVYANEIGRRLSENVKDMSTIYTGNYASLPLPSLLKRMEKLDQSER